MLGILLVRGLAHLLRNSMRGSSAMRTTFDVTLRFVGSLLDLCQSSKDNIAIVGRFLELDHVGMVGVYRKCHICACVEKPTGCRSSAHEHHLWPI
jgi:hypothetical protein